MYVIHFLIVTTLCFKRQQAVQIFNCIILTFKIHLTLSLEDNRLPWVDCSYFLWPEFLKWGPTPHPHLPAPPSLSPTNAMSSNDLSLNRVIYYISCKILCPTPKFHKTHTHPSHQLLLVLIVSFCVWFVLRWPPTVDRMFRSLKVWCIWLYLCVCTSLSLSLSAHVRVNTWVHACIHVCVYACLCVCVYVHMSVCVCAMSEADFKRRGRPVTDMWS